MNLLRAEKPRATIIDRAAQSRVAGDHKCAHLKIGRPIAERSPAVAWAVRMQARPDFRARAVENADFRRLACRPGRAIHRRVI